MIIRENRIETVRKLVSLKNDHPRLKVILALGGWGGCETCSEVFASPEGRSEFACSVRELLEVYGADGIDLDWEYPAIPGYPGHPYLPDDKENFSLLVKNLREVLGDGYEIGFAAGGFKRFFDESVEWDETASAPYAFSEENGLFVTYDNRRSVRMKTNYAKEKGLAGIMFWQLGGDRPQDGLLHAIYEELK